MAIPMITEFFENAFKFANETLDEMNRQTSLNNAIKEVKNAYVNDCNKELSEWTEFTEEDVTRELGHCVDYFVLMKEGDMIQCDCGNQAMELHFEGKKTVYKDGTGSLSAKDIPKQIERGCFGTCLLEEPSRHPGTKESGGNVCEPDIVGTSWLDTYNNVKIEDLEIAIKKESWLACKYMGRIMSVDAMEEIDTAEMTEDEAFDMMLKWVKGEKYIPQVILDKITLIYASKKSDYFNSYEYKGKEELANINKYDAKIIAWSMFVNDLWETKEQKEIHLPIRPVLLKAMCMQESRLGGGAITFNSDINIIQSLNIGDGTLWHLANYYPYEYTFDMQTDKGIKQDILAWANVPGKNNNDKVTNGHVEFNKDAYFNFDENEKVLNERNFWTDRENYFGQADIGDDGSPLLCGGIKKVNNGKADSKETIMVVYNQQSTDMSLYAGALLLANSLWGGKTEKEAVYNYNYKGDPDYVEEVGEYLKMMGTQYLDVKDLKGDSLYE